MSSIILDEIGECAEVFAPGLLTVGLDPICPPGGGATKPVVIFDAAPLSRTGRSPNRTWGTESGS